jgi:hypothetical protein
MKAAALVAGIGAILLLGSAPASAKTRSFRTPSGNII